MRVVGEPQSMELSGVQRTTRSDKHAPRWCHAAVVAINPWPTQAGTLLLRDPRAADIDQLIEMAVSGGQRNDLRVPL